MLLGTVAKYRAVAQKMMMADLNMREAVYRQRMKGNAVVAVKHAPKMDGQAGAAVLGRIGQHYGVELGDLLTGD